MLTWFTFWVSPVCAFVSPTDTPAASLNPLLELGLIYTNLNVLLILNYLIRSVLCHVTYGITHLSIIRTSARSERPVLRGCWVLAHFFPQPEM